MSRQPRPVPPAEGYEVACSIPGFEELFGLPGVRTPAKQHNSRILHMTLSRISCRETPLPSSQLIALSPLPGCSRLSARRDDGAPPDAGARLRHRCSCRVGLRFIVGVGSGRGCTRGGPAGRWQ